MAVNFASNGRKRLLHHLKTGGTCICALFVNDYTPAVDDEFADYDPAGFSGYQVVTINWGAITINGDDNAEMTGSLCQFVHDGGVTSEDCYGWYIYDTSSGPEELIASERFADAPRSMAVLDDTIDVTPKIVQGECV